MTSSIQEFSNRESLLEANAVLITQLQNRLRVKRFRANENDTSKLEYIKTLIGAIQAQNEILADTERNEIANKAESKYNSNFI